MSRLDADAPNPYQPPQVELPLFAPPASGSPRLMKVLRDFRTQVVA